MASFGLFTGKNKQGSEPWTQRAIARMPRAHLDTPNGCAYDDYGSGQPRGNPATDDDGAGTLRNGGARFGTPVNEGVDTATGTWGEGNRSGE
jgi:hypothetical protein